MSTQFDEIYIKGKEPVLLNQFCGGIDVGLSLQITQGNMYIQLPKVEAAEMANAVIRWYLDNLKPTDEVLPRLKGTE